MDEPAPHNRVGVGSDSDDSLHRDGLEVWGEAEGDDDEMSVIWEDTLLTGGEGSLLCWGNENSPLEVAPLVMAGPCSDAATFKNDGEVCTRSLTQATGIASAPLDWVLETMTAFEIVLGVSFKGHEEQLMSIL